MKFLVFLAAVVMGTPMMGSAAVEGRQAVEKEVYVHFNDVYIQRDRGFVEPNELLVTGMFPNGCYKWLGAEVKHLDDYTHEVRGTAKVVQGNCIMMMVPFTKEVDVGLLKEGTHTVRVVNNDGTTFEKTFDKKRQ